MRRIHVESQAQQDFLANRFSDETLHLVFFLFMNHGARQGALGHHHGIFFTCPTTVPISYLKSNYQR